MKLAFTGVAGSGKDYLVQHLVKKYAYSRVSFSDQLKKLAAMIYPWLERDYEPITKEKPLNKIVKETGEIITKSPREIWMSLNSLRDVENQLFLRMAQDEIKRTMVDNIVISDIRPKIEYDWCIKNGFKIIYVNPLKIIYEPNKFDEQVLPYKVTADYVFDNDFCGLDRFDKFISEILEESK
jgi:dephospho-CoA kinase